VPRTVFRKLKWSTSWENKPVLGASCSTTNITSRYTMTMFLEIRLNRGIL
jgi:hypothetical protein